MRCNASSCFCFAVALLAEGVDRNPSMVVIYNGNKESPSSRRAWIEIAIQAAGCKRAGGRPPRGGRG